jgi:ferritin
MDIFYDLAIKHLEEEIEDACEYLKEAEDAKEGGKEYLAAGMRKVALDEYSHAKFLRDYLHSKHVYNEHEKHEHIEKKWHRLREKLGLE